MFQNRLVSHSHQAEILTSLILLLSSSPSALALEQTEGTTARSAAPDASVTASSSSTTTGSSTAVAPPATPAVGGQDGSTAVITTPDVDKPGKIMVKPGMPISVTMAAEDLVPTDDVELARKQVDAYPDSPEAAFILAVALSKTSRVEDALKEAQRAKRLASSQGGQEYLDKTIKNYEQMLESYPDENRVRYGLAWAYYMKAYLLAKSHPANAAIPAISEGATTVTQMKSNKQNENWMNNAAAAQVLAIMSPQLAKTVSAVPGAISNQSLPHIKGALELASPDVVPQIKQNYESALKNLDELLARTPDDIWARVYRAHLYAEFSGNIGESMNEWRRCQKQNPSNPAPYFFLAEGYLKEGNLRECLTNISRAIALRAVGN